MSLIAVTLPSGTTNCRPGLSRNVALYPDPPAITANANGQAVVDTNIVDMGELLGAGFVIGPQSGSTANRPTTQLAPGVMYFDTTLGKPVWRNGANSGWVDATGTVA